MDDPRLMRFLDLEPCSHIIIRCPCGRCTEFTYGYFQTRHGIPSDALIYDLKFKMRCRHCRRKRGFGVAVWDGRNLQSTSHRTEEIVIVEMTKP
jgi:hypothetical protein